MHYLKFIIKWVIYICGFFVVIILAAYADGAIGDYLKNKKNQPISLDPPEEAVAMAPKCRCDLPTETILHHFSDEVVKLRKEDGSCIEERYIICSPRITYDHKRRVSFNLEGTPGPAVNGETFTIGGKHVRLWGIDAPDESEPFYEEALMQLEEELTGQHIIHCYKRGKDGESQLVLRCFLTRTNVVGYFSAYHDIAAEMVGHGYATDNKEQSGGYYSALEARARAEHRGMWATSDASTDE